MTVTLPALTDDLSARLLGLLRRRGVAPSVEAEVRALLADQAILGDSTVRIEAAPHAIGVASFADGLEDRGLLGQGSMGEVRRVHDPRLGRTLAMKLCRGDPQSAQAAAFIEEARITARLQHPGVVPVHSIGQLPDGRHYFTMQEVRGRTLAAITEEVHRAAATGGSVPMEWSFRRLVDAFLRACEAVAYAHNVWVVHRDIKPANIMLDDFGQVLVLDWGLARAMRPEELGAPPIIDETTHADDYEIAGTPAYMAPEQALGQLQRIGPWTDVYALGAVLFQIMRGSPPVAPGGLSSMLARVISGRLVPLDDAAFQPPELVAIANRALQREPRDRFPDAGALAREVAAWLDGAQRHDQAMATVAEADTLLDQAALARAEAGRLRAEAAKLLAGTHSYDAVDALRPGWQTQDAAARAEAEADLLTVRYTQLLQSALRADPDLVEAKDRLADHHRRCQADAEERRELAAAEAHAAELRVHDRGRHADWLRGDGALILHSEPVAAARLYRYELKDRQLEAVFVRDLGDTPLDIILPRGSYRVDLSAPGRASVAAPVLIGRLGRWDGVPPGESASLPLPLPEQRVLGDGVCAVPAGWCRIGGDPEAADGLSGRRLWVDGFAIQQMPVTFEDYLFFLNELAAQGGAALALAHMPAEGVAYRAADGFSPAPEQNGTVPALDWPVTWVSWFDAAAYAAWWAARTGQPWRLPCSEELEKAARGVDGRFYPWGDTFHATWACVIDSQPGRPERASVSAFPADRSPYGVRHLAGNVRGWCADHYRREGPAGDRLCIELSAPDSQEFRAVRGGAFSSKPNLCRAAGRFGSRPADRFSSLGFRLALSL